MQHTTKNLPKNKAEIRVEIDPAEMLPHLTAAVARMSTKMSFPGFRPGKAPYDVVAKQVGEAAVWEEALEDAVRTTFVKIVTDDALTTVGQPEIKVEKLAPGNPVIYTATVSLLPSTKLPDSLAFKIEKKAEPVTNEDVMKTVEELRKLIATEKPVDRPAQKGDKLELDINVAIDNVAIEGGKSRSHPTVLGEGNFIPGFEDQIIGMTKGQTREFPLTFPKEYHARHLSGKTATFTVTLKSVAERVLPPLDDAFAEKVARTKTYDELKNQIKMNLVQERIEKAEQAHEVALLEALVKKSSFGEIPDVLVASELDRMVGEIKHDLEHRGMKYEDYLSSMKKDEAAFRKELAGGALNRVKTTLVIRAIADAEKFAVTEKEIEDEVQRIRSTVKDEEKLKELETEGFIRYVETVLINRKAVDALKAKQTATIA